MGGWYVIAERLHTLDSGTVYRYWSAFDDDGIGLLSVRLEGDPPVLVPDYLQPTELELRRGFDSTSGDEPRFGCLAYVKIRRHYEQYGELPERVSWAS